MLYKNDWEQIEKRFDAWWNHDLYDRVLLQLTAPKSKPNHSDSPVNKHELNRDSFEIIREWREKGFDHTFLLDDAEHRMESTYYGGEAFPNFWVNLGPGSLASYIGCEANYTDHTIWFGPPILKSWDDVHKVQFDEYGSLWTATKELTEQSCKRGQGRFPTSITDLGGGMDVLASLRGTQALLFDLIENPEPVKQVRDYIVKYWLHCYNTLFEIFKTYQSGTFGWLPTWCTGRVYPLQCDFSAMISPTMFEEFVVPELQTLGRNLDQVIYHLDGPDAVNHIDILLELPELDAIQWVPGEGTPPAIQWIPLLKKIQAKGKSLYIYATKPQEVFELMDSLSPKGLLICMGCETEEVARSLIEQTEQRFGMK
jgi:hypothetical protein